MVCPNSLYLFVKKILVSASWNIWTKRDSFWKPRSLWFSKVLELLKSIFISRISGEGADVLGLLSKNIVWKWTKAEDYTKDATAAENWTCQLDSSDLAALDSQNSQIEADNQGPMSISSKMPTVWDDTPIKFCHLDLHL